MAEEWESFFKLLSQLLSTWEEGVVRDSQLESLYTKLENFAGKINIQLL